MRVRGPLTDWNDAKGYGFVVSQDGHTRAFVHIKAFARGSRRPVDGDVVSFEPVTDARGRVTATAVQFLASPAPMRHQRQAGDEPAASATWPDTVICRLQPRPARNRPAARMTWRVLLVLAWFAALAGAVLSARLGLGLVIAVVILSLVSLAMYAHDKHAARQGAWRTPENSLHLADLVGGWPGGLLAQAWFHHKTAKASFQVVFWLTVAVNVAAITWLGLGGGAAAEWRDLLRP